MQRIAGILLHMRHPDIEDWVSWHTRIWRAARHRVQQNCGGSRVGVQKCARFASSVVGRVIRWRSEAGLSAMRSLEDGRLGPWTRQRKG